MSKKVFITTGAIALVGGLATATAVSSCDQVCTMEAQPSVVVRFFDDAGGQVINDVEGSVVWWQITDPTILATMPDPSITPPATEGFQMGECADAACSEWIAGWEREGTIEVRATVCGHEYIERIEVPMEADGCHVDTQPLDIFVDTSECEVEDVESGPGTHPTDPEGCDDFQHRPSVITQVVTTIDGGYVPYPPDGVYALLHKDDGSVEEAISGECMDHVCSKWALGTEQTGQFEIKVDACGTTFTETVDVGMQPDGCHVATQQTVVVVDPNTCSTKIELDTIEAKPVPKVCDLMAYPSAMVWTVLRYDDYIAPTPVEQVWFTHEDQRYKARCFDAGADEAGCSVWIAGYEQAGNLSLSTEYCDREVSSDIRVGMTEDGCHVQTEFVSMMLDSTGCIAGEAQPATPPPPPGGEER